MTRRPIYDFVLSVILCRLNKSAQNVAFAPTMWRGSLFFCSYRHDCGFAEVSLCSSKF